MNRSSLSRRRRRGLSLLAAASLMATAACGSTVQSSGQRVLSGGDLPADGSAVGEGVGGDGLGGDGLGGEGLGDVGPDGVAAPGTADPGSFDAPGTSPDAPLGGAGTTDARGAGSGAAEGPAGSGGTRPGAPGAPAAGAQGAGVTAKEIFIGITYTSNGDAANAAVGAAISRGDERKNSQAVIDQINERGGVAGRKLVAVFHAYDAQSSEPNESQDQAACATFTEDKRVYASTSLGLTENFSACLRKAGVLQIAAGSIIFHDDAYMKKYPSFFHQRLTQERMMRDLVASLSRQGYFTGWDANLARPASAKAKIGIVTLDEPTFLRPIKNSLLPALARAGHPVDPSLVFPIAFARTTSQAGPTAADVQNATLRLRDAGVTHVILQDATAFMSLTFLNSTRNQRYYPRLGITSGTGVQALFTAGVVDAQALNGAMGLGWLPTLDLPAGKGDAFLTSATKECLDNNKKRTGQTFTSTNAAIIALAACDSLNMVAAAINKAGATINFDTGRRAVESLEGSLRTAVVPKVFFGPNRHDGLETGFDLFWDSGCKCAKYRDKGHRIAS